MTRRTRPLSRAATRFSVISGLGQIGMAVCWALIVPFTAPTAIGFRVFLWLLVVAMIGFQGSAVYFHWQADQLQLPTS